ncbi:transcription factor S [Candidatus Woesearchaeota archaeon]|nr:MAG: transcription factor S [Candidatus Woesearchaeota archaeon]
MFCPKCGAILKVKQEKGKRFFSCSCGYTNRTEKATLSETVEKEDEIAVVEQDDRNLPVTDATCPKCGHDKAGFWTAQTRAGDEPETRFFKCVKCGNTWREAS